MNGPALIEKAVEVADDVIQCLFVRRGGEADQILTGGGEEILGELDGTFDSTFVVGDAGENGGIHRLAFEEHAAEFLLLRLGGTL